MNIIKGFGDFFHKADRRRTAILGAPATREPSDRTETPESSVTPTILTNLTSPATPQSLLSLIRERVSAFLPALFVSAALGGACASDGEGGCNPFHKEQGDLELGSQAFALGVLANMSSDSPFFYEDVVEEMSRREDEVDAFYERLHRDYEGGGELVAQIESVFYNELTDTELGEYLGPNYLQLFTHLACRGQILAESSANLDLEDREVEGENDELILIQGPWQIRNDNAYARMQGYDLHDPIEATRVAAYYHARTFSDSQEVISDVQIGYRNYDKMLVIDLLFQSYYNGPGGVRRLMRWFMDNYSIEDVIAELGNRYSGLDLARFMIEQAVENRRRGGEYNLRIFGSGSERYVKRIFALAYLQLQESSTRNEAASSLNEALEETERGGEYINQRGQELSSDSTDLIISRGGLSYTSGFPGLATASSSASGSAVVSEDNIRAAFEQGGVFHDLSINYVIALQPNTVYYVQNSFDNEQTVLTSLRINHATHRLPLTYNPTDPAQLAIGLSVLNNIISDSLACLAAGDRCLIHDTTGRRGSLEIMAVTRYILERPSITDEARTIAARNGVTPEYVQAFLNVGEMFSYDNPLRTDIQPDSNLSSLIQNYLDNSELWPVPPVPSAPSPPVP